MPSSEDLLLSISADTALETPQILIKWTYKEHIPDVEFIRIRRSTFRYPEDTSEGTAVLDEAFNPSSPRTSFADTEVVGDTVYYYSVFFDHKGAFSQAKTSEYDIERFGELKSVARDNFFVPNQEIGTASGTDDTFQATTDYAPLVPGFLTVFSSEPALTAKDDGGGSFVGDVLGGDINYTSGVLEVVFDEDPQAGSAITMQYYVYVEHKYWILVRDSESVRGLWLYDTLSKTSNLRINLEGVLRSDETPVDIGWVLGHEVDQDSRYINIVTDQRMFVVTISTLEEGDYVVDPDTITQEVPFESVLDPGFEVAGATLDAESDDGEPRIRILDRSNRNAKLLEFNGTVVRTMDLTGLLKYSEDLRGLAYNPSNHELLVGNNNIYFGISSNTTAPTAKDIVSHYPVLRRISGGVDLTHNQMIQIDDRFGLLEFYTLQDFITTWQLEREPLPGYLAVGTFGVAGLWLLEEESDDAIDYSGNGYDGVVTGNVSRQVPGKWTYAYKFEDENAYVDISAAGSDFLASNGTVGIWYQVPYSGYTPSSDRIMFNAFVDSNNHFTIYWRSTGALEAEFARGGTVRTASVANVLQYLTPDLFHYIVAVWGGTTLTIYIDGVSRGSVGGLSGTFSGTPSIFIGNDGGDSALGIYDSVELARQSKAAFTRYSLTTLGNRAHSVSGRDYDDSTIKEAFPFRNELKRYFGEFVLRNDFDRSYLPEGQELPTGEVIFREDRSEKETLLGHLGRTARLFGLLLDRNVDRRRFFMNHLTARSVESEFIPLLADLIGVEDFDDLWNVDKRRKYLEVMFQVMQVKGTLTSFIQLARFLGFSLWSPGGSAPFLVSRRFFDSSVDPFRPSTPFDTSTFDSSASGYHFVALLFSFFKEEVFSTTGSTSAPATREFTDASGAFLSQAKVGSLLTIMDIDNPGDNGQYIVEQINSDTVLTVDRDFLQGSLSDLSYTLSWQIPCIDPYVDSIFGRFKKIKARWQKLECVNVAPGA